VLKLLRKSRRSNKLIELLLAKLSNKGREVKIGSAYMEKINLSIVKAALKILNQHKRVLDKDTHVKLFKSKPLIT
jgi:hypothetical protein